MIHSAKLLVLVTSLTTVEYVKNVMHHVPPVMEMRETIAYHAVKKLLLMNHSARQLVLALSLTKIQFAKTVMFHV